MPHAGRIVRSHQNKATAEVHDYPDVREAVEAELSFDPLVDATDITVRNTNREQRAWRSYLRTGTLLAARLNRGQQTESGLSLPEYEVLVQLTEAPDSKLRPAQLGRALDWEAEQALARALPHDSARLHHQAGLSRRPARR